MKDNAASNEPPEQIVTVQFLPTPKPTDTPGLRPEWIDLGKIVGADEIHGLWIGGKKVPARLKKSSE